MLRQVLGILQNHSVQINRSKHVLNTTAIKYLSYHISEEGIKPSSKKLQAIFDAPAPSSILEVQSFLGKVTYYSKFVEGFQPFYLPYSI